MASQVRVRDVIAALADWAPPAYQESYDNARLLCGDPEQPITGVLCCLDSTEEVIREAAELGCNLVVAHHPILFGSLKSLTGRTYAERALLAAIRLNVALFAAHTNLDAVHNGVNDRMADRLGLVKRQILDPKRELLLKLVTFVPVEGVSRLRQALFDAGAGVISNYDHCSFNTEGQGTFRGNELTKPHVGERGQDHAEPEIRVEVILPRHKEQEVLRLMKKAHPYEEVAYDLYPLLNEHPQVGHGLVGELTEPLSEPDFLALLKDRFRTPCVRHSPLTGLPIKRVALCGGAGIFLISKALQSGAQAFVTADVKYHQFFDAEGKLLLADVGHYESEQFTAGLLAEFLSRKFDTFAVRLTSIVTNPVNYF